MIFRKKNWLTLKSSLMAVALLFNFGCKKPELASPQSNTGNFESSDYYTQGHLNRVAAEWEPALGTMIAWPLAIPHQLAIELAQDNHLYTVVSSDSAKNIAQSWFNKWGIPNAKVTFIVTDQGEWSWWTRDWGPSAVFNSSKQYFISNGKFIYGSPLSTLACNSKLEFELEIDQYGQFIPTTEENDAPIAVANKLGYPILDLPFINTGGNVATDGIGAAFSTCILNNENNHYGVSRNSFFQMNESMLGIKSYHIISNYEKLGIQHIDCFMKIINEETILVAQPPSGHKMSSIYENIVNNELSKMKTSYGRPYKIKRIKTASYKNDDLAAYTNSLILNKVIYVPLFGIGQDAEALDTWRKAMPGYTVKGFKYPIQDEPVVAVQVSDLYNGNGWNYGDALHCRTRAVWDPEMIFISTKNITPIVDSEHVNKVHTTIINYSGNGLNKDKCKLLWRIKGTSDWKDIVLTATEDESHFFAEIPKQKSNVTIEYYIQAVSTIGKIETHPRSAPLGFHTFSIQ